ncbi:MAG TPA: glucose-1-phosphate cytidylyltransferase [Gammaproteobacteria bacterium]|nr:MAG: glucose-1-phosphate cytidylyltransferase [Gammaproteobacteria bacterium RIFCSPHIGHO2_12_FULL_41_20]HLB43525.1 glucose-1-phosphate cytidylyltransferase [Gammaproteobacteria bacterium]
MKVVILCGGLGTRLSEETQVRPKPLVNIGNRPILWHIMKIYSSYGFKNFLLAVGYKGEMVKQYFLDYYSLGSDFNINLSNGEINYINRCREDWMIDVIDTGLHSLTGGRLHRLEKYLPNETFMLTYGDGVSNVNILKLLEFHRSHGKLATVTAVHPVARFGEMELKGNMVHSFNEKPQTRQGWINGGFFVFEPGIFKYLKGDMTILEKEPLENLAHEEQLAAYLHDGFWHCMDTVRDISVLESLCASGNAPWCVWDKKMTNTSSLMNAFGEEVT